MHSATKPNRRLAPHKLTILVLAASTLALACGVSCFAGQRAAQQDPVATLPSGKLDSQRNARPDVIRFALGAAIDQSCAECHMAKHPVLDAVMRGSDRSAPIMMWDHYIQAKSPQSLQVRRELQSSGSN